MGLTGLILSGHRAAEGGENAATFAAGSLPRGLRTLWSDGALSSIPPALAAATWLQHLVFVDFWGPVRLDPAGLDSLVGLTALELEDCRLEVPPPQLSALTALCQLRLSKNPLGDSATAAASWGPLGALQHLSALSLQDCGLRELPAVLSQLSALKASAHVCFLLLLPSTASAGLTDAFGSSTVG